MAVLQPSPFAALLKRYRVSAGLTQEELAERARLSVRGISDLERGVNLSPRPATLQQIADALEISEPERACLQAATRGLQIPTPAGPRSGEIRSVGPEQAPWPIVGRAGELAAIDRHLAGEGPPLQLLAGEPGIGKTRLLQYAMDQAAAGSIVVLSGGCQRRSGQEPYAPLVEALSACIERLPRSRLRASLQSCAWLARLLPELADLVNVPLPLGTLEQGRERRLVFAAVLRFLQNLAGPSGVLLVLDDLQWAGRDAFDLLITLVRSAQDVPLRVLGAYRDTEIGPQHPLSVALADLAHAGLVTQRSLAPLAGPEAAELLRTLAPSWMEAQAASRILERAEGVPFFLVSWAQGLQSEVAPSTTADQVPWTLVQGIRQRVEALPDVAQAVLGVAAVVGREAPQALLLAAADQPEAAVLAGLDAASRAGLLVAEQKRTYRFAHDVIREVVEAGLGSGHHTLFHRRVGEVLERLSEGSRQRRAAEIAWHFLEGDDSQRALTYSVLAGDGAEGMFAHEEAERHYRTALELAGALGDRPREAEALAKLGEVLRTVGRYDDAVHLLVRALELHRALGDLDRAGRAVAQLADVLFFKHAWKEAVERVESFLQGVDTSEPSLGLASCYTRLATLLYHNERTDEGLAAAERGAELARAIGDTRMLVQTELHRGDMLAELGRLRESAAVLDGAIPLVEALGDSAQLHQALQPRADVYIMMGEIERGRAEYARAVALAERMGDVGKTMFTVSRLAWSHFILGEWQEARQQAERALDMRRAVDTPWVWVPLLGLGEIALAEGRWEEASRHLQEVTAIADATENHGVQPRAQGRLAERDLLAGHAEAALARLLPLASQQGRALSLSLPAGLLAWAYLETGAVSMAEDTVRQEVERGIAQGNKVGLVDALRIQGMVLTRQGRWEDAGRAFADAASMARGMPYPYAEARALYELGLMHAQQGEPQQAQARLDEALSIFRRLGAKKDVERTELALGALAPLSAKPAGGMQRGAP